MPTEVLDKKELLKAVARFENAKKNLAKAIQLRYPVGVRVSVELGKSIVVGPVVGYGPSWSLPAAFEVLVKNERTGKTRSFDGSNPSFYQATVHPEIVDETC